MSRPRTSTNAKRTLFNKRYEALRKLGVPPKTATCASAHPLRFCEALELAGGNVADYPEESLLSYGGRPHVENEEAPARRRRYAKLRAMGADPEIACKACKTGVMFHQLRAELEASNRAAE